MIFSQYAANPKAWEFLGGSVWVGVSRHGPGTSQSLEHPKQSLGSALSDVQDLGIGYSLYWVCLKMLGIFPMIAIFHRDNDQQNHWVQWGLAYFQTHPTAGVVLDLVKLWSRGTKGTKSL